MRIVVIGGVAAGTSAAAQAKRRAPKSEVVLLERDGSISYGACGMPYNIADPQRALSELVAVTPEQFRSERKVDVRLRHDVLAIDVAAKGLLVRDLTTQSSYELSYDKLIIATGAEAVRPKLRGLNLPGVFTLRTLEDGERLKQALATREVKRAVLVGGGYIGLEMAESLRMRNVEVHIVEKAPQVLPGFEPSIAQLAQQELERNGVSVETGAELSAITQGGGGGSGLSLTIDGKPREADLVLVSVGVRPSVQLAKAAGIQLGESGAIAVDEQMRTNQPDVFAAGDCAESRHLVSKQGVWIPLGTTANKQGKVAGANAVGAEERFSGIVGTAAFKVFGLEVGRTGLGRAEIEKLGLDAVSASSKHLNHAESFGPSGEITTVLFAEKGSERLLGAQMIGRGVVGKRIDVLAVALTAGMRAEQVEELDLSYAPPIAPVYDPVLIAANVLRKQLAKG